MTFAALALALCLQDPDPVFSGPQKGEKTPGFAVLAMAGPEKGEKVDYVEKWAGAPTCFVFIHELTRPGGQLFRRIDDYGDRHKDRLKVLIVSLHADTLEGELRLPPTLNALRLKSVVGVSVDGKEGPGAWGLNKDMTITVVVAKDNVVVANWALRSPNETDFDKIKPELDKLTEPPLDTPEQMRDEIKRLRAEIESLRAEIEKLKAAQAGMGRPGGMERPSRPEAPKQPLPGKAPSDPQLVTYIRALIQKDADDEDLDKVVAEIDAYIKDSDDLKRQMKDAVILLDHLGYGNDHSKRIRAKYKE